MRRPALTRPFDTSLTSNRFVLLLTPIAAGIAGLVALLGGESLVEAVGWGVSGGGSAFLAWAIARELDPDRPALAGLAAVATPFGLIWARPDLWSAAVVLLAVRAVAGTTGRALRWADLLLMGVVGGAALTADTAGPALAVAGLGLMLTVWWTDPGRRVPTLATAVVCAALTTVAWVRADLVSDPAWVQVGVAGGIALIGLASPRRIEVGADRVGGVISAVRVRAGRLVALGAGGGSIVLGPMAILAPVWVALWVAAVSGLSRSPAPSTP